MEQLSDSAQATLTEERPGSPQAEETAKESHSGEPIQPSRAEERLKLESSFKSGASWFYWLAALSLINSIIAVSGGSWAFLFGLAVTQFVDGAVLLTADESGAIPGLAKAIGFSVNIAIAGLFVLFGWLAKRRYSAVFMIGIVAYTFDALLILLVQDYLATAFHVWVLVSLSRGFKNCRKLNGMDRRVVAGSPA